MRPLGNRDFNEGSLEAYDTFGFGEREPDYKEFDLT